MGRFKKDRPLSAYPMQFQRIAEMIREGEFPLEVTLSFPDEKAAHSWKFTFYELRYTLQKVSSEYSGVWAYRLRVRDNQIVMSADESKRFEEVDKILDQLEQKAADRPDYLSGTPIEGDENDF